MRLVVDIRPGGMWFDDEVSASSFEFGLPEQ